MRTQTPVLRTGRFDRRAGRCVIAGFGIVALVVAVSACDGTGGATKSNSGKGSPSSVTAARSSAGGAQAASAGLTGNTPCEKSGPPASVGQVTDEFGHNHRGPVPQVPITDAATATKLQQQLDLARAVPALYPTVAAATKAGYFQSTVYVPCIGAHYTNVLLIKPYLDPAHPAELLYDGTAPDAKIVGLSYLIVSDGPPQGFAGPNNHWHRHNANGGLCLQGGLVIGSETMSPQQCTSLGGRKEALDNLWMAHLWVVSSWDSAWGLFSPENPQLGGRIGGTVSSS